MPAEGQKFNLAPFVDGKAVPLASWNNHLTKEEKAEVKKLLPSIKEAVDRLHKDYGCTQLISIFMRRRIQPLQDRPSTMWEYSGSQDASRMKRKDFATQEALDKAVHSMIKEAKTKKLPSDCSVNPYGGDTKLHEVRSSALIESFTLISSVPSSLTHFFIVFQGHPKYECLPPTPENPKSQENLDDLPSANSPQDREGEGDSLFDEEAESSSMSRRNKEGRTKEAMDVDAQDIPEGAGDSTSAVPIPSKTRDAHPASTGDGRPVNSLGVPIFSS